MNTIIVGAGASGLACGIKIKQNNPSHKVVILEHLDQAGKKILATGNGRCNLTNKNAKGYEATSDFFKSLGLVMREDDDGRMYPYSNQATTVLSTLLDACKKYGIEIITDCNVIKAEKIDGIYNVYTNKGVMVCEYLVLATGGKSQKSLGSDGSGYQLARQFNHKITNLSPALVQLKSPNKNCRALKGLRTKCLVKIEINSHVEAQEYGELLFTEYGISGIVTMNLSQHINDSKITNGADKAIAIIDFIPEMSESNIQEHYEKFGTLSGILPEKLCTILQKQSGNDYQKMAKYVKNWRIIITGTRGFDFAQITSGGVDNDELTESFESKFSKGLFIIGELTNNQFTCGGFNLDFAFSSGISAGNCITSK